MRAVADDRVFLVEVGPVRNETRGEVDKSAQADPPGHD